MHWHFIFKYRWLLVLLVIGFCVAAQPYFKKAVNPNNTPSIWLHKLDPVLENYRQFQDEFGNDRIITVVFQEEDGILQSEILKKINLFTNRLSHIQGVKEVSSIITARDFRRIKTDSTTKIRLTTYFDDTVQFSLRPEIKEELLSSPLIVNRFINKKADVALLIIKLNSFNEVENKTQQIITNIKNAALIYPGKENIHLGGADVLSQGLNKLSQHDFALFSGLGFVLMFIITGLFYKRLLYLLLVSIVCACSVWIAFAVHGIMGYRINIFSVIVPPLIITLGIISVLHLINEYENLLRESHTSDTTGVAKKAIGNIFKPALYAMLTTIIGFASLFTSPTAALKEFSILSSVSVIFLFLLTFLFSSILLPFQRKPSKPKEADIGFRLGTLSAHILKHAALYRFLATALVMISIFGMRKINNDMYVFGYFPKNDKVFSDHKFMLKNWGEYYPIDLLLETSDSTGLNNSSLIKALMDFDKEMRSNPLVKNHLDFTTLMDRYANVTFRKDLAELIDNPFISARFIEGFMEQLKERPSGLITTDLRKARIIFNGPLLSVRETEKSFAIIDSVAVKHFKGIGKIEVAGYPLIYIKMMNYAFDSMKSSLYSSFILIFISMIVMLRSFRTAIIALVPNVFPVVLLLGFLGFSQINLDLATCTVTAIVMGIAIDDTIYFLHKYRKARKTNNTLESIELTHRSVGKVILVSSLVMIAGFSIMLLASLKTVVYFGLLAMVSVVAAIVGDLFVLPLLLKWLDKDKGERDLS